MSNAPSLTRGGIIFPIENNQHIVGLYGFSKDCPPDNESAFFAFAKSLRTNTIYNAIKDAQPVTEIKRFIKNESQFLQYNKMKNWPKGFIVVGDSIASFNPIYGQGITCIVLAMEKLKTQLNSRSTLDSQDCKFIQSKLCNNYRLAWMISQNEDLRWPETSGMKTDIVTKMLHKFSDMVARASTKDSTVTYAYYFVLHMTKSPVILLRPDILLRILIYGSKST
ncbi:MAG: hypothetical protein MRK00_07010 [Nitrosomonas sp.]|nr:hypothetical protein [Nitrosomonas sp.]